ncbi:BAG family molecular chaperone regulator 1-like [Benincasa hispida]|uniref:BAG family molecular chaperone regulator 1-like n=1 Tax=Benincasa hispida TaxID=102211 RepID=UPI0019017C6E|nr:BAG family molecular chaperone regulator 1-like [Benincasa hispida]
MINMVSIENQSHRVSELEIRPGGMLVQMRDLNSNNPSFPTIKVKVKFGSSYHHIQINSHASFGELKKLLAEPTGLHPEEQKLIYKNKERNSKAYLDVARVKNGSKIVLIEDILSKERRCLEMLSNKKFEKSSKLLKEINLEVNHLSQEVGSFHVKACKEGRVSEKEVDDLTELLMRKLIQLDEIEVVGDLRLQRREQVREVQKQIETLDMIKLQYCITLTTNNGNANSNEDFISTTKGKQTLQPKQQCLRIVKEALRNSESVVVTTKWETFD